MFECECIKKTFLEHEYNIHNIICLKDLKDLIISINLFQLIEPQKSHTQNVDWVATNNSFFKSTAINEFNIMRKNDYNVQELVGSDDGVEKEIYYYHERSAINTISKDLAEKRQTKPREIIKKKTKSLNKIIENSPYEKKKINFMSIDIENYEYEALKNFDFKKYKIDLIVTECTDMSQNKLETYTQSLDYITKTNLYRLLKNNDYKMINWVNSDLVFARNNLEI